MVLSLQLGLDAIIGPAIPEEMIPDYIEGAGKWQLPAAGHCFRVCSRDR